MDWADIKKRGSSHYKSCGVEPIDLYKALTPNPSLNVLEVKALTDCMKYAHRMLTTGANEKDCEKIKHYIDMVLVCLSERANG